MSGFRSHIHFSPHWSELFHLETSYCSLTGSLWGQGRQPTNIPAAAKQPQAAQAEHRAGREVEEAAVPNSFTDLIHDDTAEGIEPLPWEGWFQQAPPAGAQRAADDVRLQDDVCLHFLGVPPNLQAQQDTLVKIQP